MVRLRRPKVIILDIEGTTTSTKFVGEVLFPYIRTHLKEYLKANWGQDELNVTIGRLRDQQRRDSSAGLSAPYIPDSGHSEDVTESVLRNVIWQMDHRKKNTALKQVQILVWVYGYEMGHIKGHVYDDVPAALHTWRNDMNIRLFVYSTGMVVAQQLLFSCSTHGNLLPLIESFFDANIGLKTDPESFRNISHKLRIDGHDILFLTDNPQEGMAALKAGCNAVLVERSGNRPLTTEDRRDFAIVRSFEEIVLE